jgi:hypothetical protein
MGDYLAALWEERHDEQQEEPDHAFFERFTAQAVRL